MQPRWIAVLACVGFAIAAPERPVLPSRYKASVVYSIPYINLDVNVHVRTDVEAGKQVIEFFDGLTSEYISVNDGEILYNIYNTTARICFNATDPDAKAALTDIFPNLTEFNYSGVQVIHGLQVQVWTRDLGRPGEHESFFWDPRLERPIRWVMHSRDQVFDAHMDDYVVDYISVHSFENSHDWFHLPDICSPDNLKAVPSQGTQPSAMIRTFGSGKGYVADGSTSFDDYVSRFNKKYTSHSHRVKHQELFNSKSATIEQMNVNHKGHAKFALNHFADLTPPKGRVRGHHRNHHHEHLNRGRIVGAGGKVQAGLGSAVDLSAPLPASWDWRDHGASSTIKDQGMCGSCWTFSTIASIESQNFLKNGGRMDKLSEQFILDCGWSESNSACFGGSEDDAGRVILESYNGFVPTDNSYGSYLSTDSYCKYVDGMSGVTIDAWVSLPSHAAVTASGEPKTLNGLTGNHGRAVTQDELIMAALVQHGLLSVSIKASEEIVFYRSGIIRTDNCANSTLDDLDHAVNLVGYGSTTIKNDENGKSEKVDYWIVRNSWSTNWGEDGYYKIERGTGRDCGITLAVTFPIISATKKYSTYVANAQVENSPDFSPAENGDDSKVTIYVPASVEEEYSKLFLLM